MAETITVGEDGKAHINWLAGADPSWYGRVLGILHRDYPEVETQVWSTAVGENAAEQVARRERGPENG